MDADLTDVVTVLIGKYNICHIYITDFLLIYMHKYCVWPHNKTRLFVANQKC